MMNSGLVDELFPEVAEVEAVQGTSTGESEQDQTPNGEVQAHEVADDEMVDTAESGNEEGQEEQADGVEAQEGRDTEEFKLGEPLSAQEFAEAFGLQDPGELRVMTTVNGEQGNVSLKDLVRSYQTEAYQTKKSQAQAAEEKARIEQWTQQQNQLTQNIVASQALVENFRKQIEENYASEDMVRLKEDDPGAYAVKQLEKTKALESLNGIVAQSQQYAQYLQQQNQQILQQKVNETSKRILGAGAEDPDALIPEWNDQKRYIDESNQIREYMIGLGYQPEDLTAFADPRFVLLMRDAARYKDLVKAQSTQKQAIEQKKVKLPKAKIVRPGAKKPTGAKPKVDRAKIMKQLNQTRSVRDASKLISHILPEDI